MRPGRLLLGMGLTGALGAGAWWTWGRDGEPVTWRTAAVERADVRQVVSATGTLEAVQTVEVGAQVSGIVAELGADFNDRVKAGQVLARIDPALLEADVASAAARLAEARAGADRLELERARVEKLHARQAATDQEREAARADHQVALAQVRSAEVALSRARRNLGYTVITAPIDGTVVQRDVEMGQTVNAGLSAPKLFLLAGDLSRMRILAAADESDIGLIKEGQAASFTVQAWPDRPFVGTVRQVRLQSSTAESVVTYTVVVDVDNAEGLLLPGMTATVEFTVAEAPDALCVTSAALRYRPDDTVTVVGASSEGAGTSAAGPGAPTGAGAAAGGGRRGGRKGADTHAGTLWVAEGEGLRAVPVKTGLRGAACTEVSGDGVTEGLSVVTGIERGAEAGSSSSSPIGPGASGGQRRPGGF
ncbi:MAG: efflux RND transporter periplasmic adaptor subunit [Myxococcota bacterium]